MKTSPRLYVSTALALLLLHFYAAPAALAWGPEGHEIEARLAYARLSPEARRAVNRLLGINAQTNKADIAQILADAANWPDSLRSKNKQSKLWKNWHHTYNWHFVDIPINRPQPRYNAAVDCKPEENGFCVIRALDEQRAILRNKHKSLDERRNALRFILHLVGDIHQPLHAADDHDTGGNGKFVCFFGECWFPDGGDKNLHSTWDGYMLRREAGSPDAHIDRLTDKIGAMSGSQVAAAQKGTTIDWAEDSHRKAREHAYRLLPQPESRTNPTTHQTHNYYVIDEHSGYYDDGIAVIDEQLIKGALRMQSYLDAALHGVSF